MKKNSNFFIIFLITIALILGITILFKMNSYKITYVVDGEVYKTVEVRKNTAIEDIPKPEKKGYAFIGWYDENQKALEAKTTITKDLTLYARWAEIVTSEDEKNMN